jgi:hypothetical protein
MLTSNYFLVLAKDFLAESGSPLTSLCDKLVKLGPSSRQFFIYGFQNFICMRSSIQSLMWLEFDFDCFSSVSTILSASRHPTSRSQPQSFSQIPSVCEIHVLQMRAELSLRRDGPHTGSGVSAGVPHLVHWCHLAHWGQGCSLLDCSGLPHSVQLVESRQFGLLR